MTWAYLRAQNSPLNTHTTSTQELAWRYFGSSSNINSNAILDAGGTRMVLPPSADGKPIQVFGTTFFNSSNYSVDYDIQVKRDPTDGSGVEMLEGTFDRYDGRAAFGFRTRPFIANLGDEIFMTSRRTFGSDMQWDPDYTSLGFATLGRIGFLHIHLSSRYTVPSSTWTELPNWDVDFDTLSAYNSTTKRVDVPADANAAVVRTSGDCPNRQTTLGRARVALYDSGGTLIRYEHQSWVNNGDNRWQSCKTSNVFPLDGVASMVSEWYANGDSGDRTLNSGYSNTTFEVEWIA